jgi:NAD+ diphosphatase
VTEKGRIATSRYGFTSWRRTVRAQWRATCEETGIEVGAVHYHSSQPWPFPGNIMLGFHAEARTTEVTIDYGELEDARWFTRDWLISHVDDDSFRIPRLDSIARRLIEDWLHGR